jgi:hypothetical protein
VVAGGVLVLLLFLGITEARSSFVTRFMKWLVKRRRD